MTLNVEKAKQLLDIFCSLDDKNQEKLLSQALKLEIDQRINSSVVESGVSVDNPKFGEVKNQYGTKLKTMAENVGSMNPTQFAALAFMMNELTNGEFTKEENIDFILTTRQLSISEFIEKNIPGADIDEARRIYLSHRKQE